MMEKNKMEEKTNYLAHHGVKGMRWGVRRYQNPDGSLTAAGRKKYGTSGGPKNGILYSGKEIKKIREERINVENKEREKIINRSKRYKKAMEEANRLLKKYELDADDGGGGNYKKFSESELKKAGQRYWNLQEQMYKITESSYDKSYNKSKRYIESKYGTAYTKQAKTRDNIKYTAAFIAMTGAFVAPHIINQRRAAIGKFKV